MSWFDPFTRNLSEVGGYYVDRDRGLLTITRVRRLEDSGKFTCKAQNAAGEVQSTHDLVVITKPTITSFENISAVVSQEAVFECRATGSPIPTLSLRQDGVDVPLIEGRDRVRFDRRTLRDETILIVSISNVERRYDGLFYCVAENRGGKVERTGHLTVEYPPDLSRTVPLVKTWESNPVNLTCIADSIPNATISWWRRGQKIYPGATYDFRQEKGVSNLFVKPLATPGSGGGDVYGSYRCEAENIHGKSSIDITLDRAYAPEQVGPITILRTTPTIIEFDITPPIRDGGLPVKRYRMRYRKEHFDENKDVTYPSSGGPYKLEGLEPRMSYMMKFAAENDVGIGYWTLEQRIVMPFESVPEPVPFILVDPMILPESGELRTSSPHEFLVQWSKPQTNGREIDQYRIRYHRVSSNFIIGIVCFHLQFMPVLRFLSPKLLYSEPSVSLTLDTTNNRKNKRSLIRVRQEREFEKPSVCCHARTPSVNGKKRDPFLSFVLMPKQPTRKEVPFFLFFLSTILETAGPNHLVCDCILIHFVL